MNSVIKPRVQSALTNRGALQSATSDKIDIVAFPGGLSNESHFVVSSIKSIPKWVKGLPGYSGIGVSGCGGPSLAIYKVSLNIRDLLRMFDSHR